MFELEIAMSDANRPPEEVEDVKVTFRPKQSAEPSIQPELSEEELDRIEKEALLRLQIYEHEHAEDFARPPMSKPAKRLLAIGSVAILFFLSFFFFETCSLLESSGNKPHPDKERLRKNIREKVLPPVSLPAKTDPDSAPAAVPAEQTPVPAPPARSTPSPPLEVRVAEFEKILRAHPTDSARLDHTLRLYFRLCEDKQDDLVFHGRILSLLLRNGQAETAVRAYRDWVSESPNSYTANMLAALVLAVNDEQAIPYLKRACMLSIGSPTEAPYRQLIEIHKRRRDWGAAADVCENLLRVFPYHEQARRERAECRIRGGALPRREYRELEQYCQNRSRSERAAFLLPTAQDFLPEGEAGRLLRDSGLEAEDFPRYQEFLYREALIFGRVLPDFALSIPPVRPSTRRYLLLYHVSRKNFAEAFHVTTPPDDFPDFYKILATWLRNDAVNTNIMAGQFLKRNAANPGTAAYRLLCRFWTGQLTAAALREQADHFTEEDETLIYLVLAEHARRAENPKSAQVLYDKAAGDGRRRTIYQTMLQTYR